MLVTLKEVLNHARANHYAVPAFDFTEDIMARTIIETAVACRSPVIMMTLQPDLDSGGGNGWIFQAAAAKAAAAAVDIPVVLHLDHAGDLATVQKALDLGYSSVMIDGSQLPFEANAQLTRSVVEVAHPRGVSVEAELGHVGGMDLDETSCAENILTEPDELARFIAQTGCDALAVSIGTAHGVYRSLPNLNIARLRELNTISEVPLVMHGGSGTPDDQIRAAVQEGICKLNIYADLRIAMYRGLKTSAQMHERIDPLPRVMFQPIRKELAAVVQEKIELLGSAGKA
jgi:fructose-bisphosphate aldolase class II